MELDFQKQKQKVAGLSDNELVARSRDPGASATDRMLIEAEIAHRGLDRSAPRASREPPPQLIKRGSNLFSVLFFVVVLLSIIAGMLEQYGVDLLDMLRELFGDKGNTELLP